MKTNATWLKPSYNVIGIIGAQSSGKSTLLNKLFNSTFDVMNVKVERKQTTRGIWSQILEQHPLLLLDIEGTDSRERWEEKQSFERRTALFGLAISNLLLVNLWLNDIGRFSASNYEILRTVFELNMQLFNLESPKKIVFVIRDWRILENEEHIKFILVKDMHKLWDSIKKTEKQSKINFDSVFCFEFITLRSFIYEEASFIEDVNQFRSRLMDPENPKNLFTGMNFNNIPIEDLYLYMSQTWRTVAENKDLNIPDQKIMVSNFRCSEIKEESFKDCREKIQQLSLDAVLRPDFDISEDLQEIMNESISFFEVNTQNYDDKVSDQVKHDLVAMMETEALRVFKPLNEKFIKANLEELEKYLKKNAAKAGSDVAKILQIIVNEKEDKRKKYLQYLTKYNLDPVKTREFKNYFEIELSSLISKFLSSSTQSFCKKMIRSYISEIDERISLTYLNFNKESWENFNIYCEDVLWKFSDEIDALKVKFEDVKVIFTDEVDHEFKNDLISTIKAILRSKQSFVYEYLIENFKNSFEISATGQPHMWRHLSDSEINDLYKKTKTDFVVTLKFFDKAILTNFDNDIIFTIDDCQKLKKKFETETANILEEVFNKKYNRNSLQKIPKWMWFVLAYFMHDNVLVWMHNPFFFVILVTFVSAGGYIYFTNKMDYVTNWYALLKRFFMKKMLDVTMQATGIRGNNEGEEGRKTGLGGRSSSVTEERSSEGRMTGGLDRSSNLGEKTSENLNQKSID